MRYADLPRTTGTGQPQPEMRCSECGDGPFSAEYGDYFWANDADEIRCRCGGTFELGRMVTRWESGNITYTVAIMLLVILPCLVFVTHALNTLGEAIR